MAGRRRGSRRWRRSSGWWGWARRGSTAATSSTPSPWRRSAATTRSSHPLQPCVFQAATLCIKGATLCIYQERGDDPKARSHSLVLTGNPGTGKTTFATLYAQLLGELKVLPEGRVVRITGAQLQDEGVKGLEEILEEFDKPGTSVLRVGRVETGSLETVF